MIAKSTALQGPEMFSKKNQNFVESNNMFLFRKGLHWFLFKKAIGSRRLESRKFMMSNKSLRDEKFELRKQISLLGGIAITTGAIVGTGIFVSPVGLLRNMHGSVGLSLTMWFACGLIAFMSSLCYCELGITFGASGGDYNNFNLAYGAPVGFIYVWTNFIIHPGQAASYLVFGRYLASLLYGEGCNPSDIVIKILATLLACVLCLVNYRSIKSSLAVEIVFAFIKFAVMLVIGIGGLIYLAGGSEVGLHNFQTAFSVEPISEITISDVARAFYQGMFPYVGWPILNFLTEEMQDAKKNMTKAALFSILPVIALYMLVNVGYFSVLSVPEMLSSKAVGFSFAAKVLGSAAWIIPVSVCMSTVGNQNGAFLGDSRGPFVAARAGHMPKVLSMIHTKYFTPAPALIANFLITFMYIMIGDFDTLIYAFGFTNWIIYGLSAASLLILRRKMPQLARPYEVPLVVPVSVCLISLFMVIAPLVQNPSPIYFYSIAFYIITLIAYYLYMVRRWRIPGTQKVTIFLQKLAGVAETDWEGFEYEK